MTDTVSFNEESVMAYLDRVITVWRRRKEDASGDDGDLAMENMAICYIDAFQSVRVSLFGELLSLPEVGESMEEVADEWTGGDSRATIPMKDSGTIGDPTRK